MWKKQLSIFFLLLFFFCFPLVSDTISEAESCKQLEQNMRKQKKRVTHRLVNSQDKLTSLEELAKMYLSELEKSDTAWEKLSMSYEELKIVVRELTLSVELWSQKSKNLSRSYDTAMGTLEREREEATEIIDSLEKQLKLYKSCAIIGGVGFGISVVFYILK